MDIRVMVANPCEVIRAGLGAVFAGTEINVVAESETYARTLELLRTDRPDVLVIDIDMTDQKGPDFLEQLHNRYYSGKIVVFTAIDYLAYVARAAVIGVSDYLLISSSGKLITEAINAAYYGKSPVEGGLMEMVLKRMNMKSHKKEAVVPNVDHDSGIFGNILTQREYQVLRHIVLGLSNKEIAKFLKISVETVKEHVRNILRKTSLYDRTQLAVWAIRHGMDP